MGSGEKDINRTLVIRLAEFLNTELGKVLLTACILSAIRKAGFDEL
jgi:hypothetical protein